MTEFENLESAIQGMTFAWRLLDRPVPAGRLVPSVLGRRSPHSTRPTLRVRTTRGDSMTRQQRMEREKLIVELLEQGVLTHREIGDRVGLSVNWILAIARKYPGLLDRRRDKRMWRHDVAAPLLVEAKLSYEEIGKIVGLSRDQVRRIGVNRHLLDARRAKRAEFAAAKRTAKLTEGYVTADEALAIVESLPVCRVCGGKVPLDRDVTCTSKCARAWPKLRYLLDASERQKHRIIQAHTVLASPEKYRPAMVDHSRRLLAGDPSVAKENRRWATPQKVALAKEFGIDLSAIEVGDRSKKPRYPCPATNITGSPCSRTAAIEGELCPWHERVKPVDLPSSADHLQSPAERVS